MQETGRSEQVEPEKLFQALMMLLGMQPYDMAFSIHVLREQLGYSDAKVKAASYETTVRELASRLKEAGYRLQLISESGERSVDH